MKRHSPRGFTLIEVMIAIAIVGILAAIAYPSYIEQVRKTRRTEGKSMLLEVAAKQERFYTENNTYANDLDDDLGYDSDPVTTEGGWYQVSVIAASATDYTLQAVPQGAQAGDTLCGALTIDSFGVKTEDGTAPDWQDCW